jgi:hypothetical protein
MLGTTRCVFNRARISLLIACSVVSLGGAAFGQVTTSSLTIGGVGTFGCASPASDPPVLETGQVAKGTLGYSYNATSQILTLTVTNTSPVVAGEQTPVIGSVFLNLPAFAISGATLLSQTGSGGPQPNWFMVVDPDLADPTTSIQVGCFGKFGIKLSDPGTIDGSIANPAATSLPGTPGSMVIGPVTFQIQIQGSSAAASSLVASAFASSLTLNAGGLTVNAAFRFHADSTLGLDESGENVLSAAPLADGGNAAGWFVGTPSGGETVTLVISGTPNWNAIMVASLLPGPIEHFNIEFPIGPDWVPLFNTTIPAGVPFVSTTITIPQSGPQLAGLVVYGLVVAVSPGLRTVSVGEQFSSFVDF